MSNPTTPFSWQMPTATDLVTDLPADFEVFGQAVATSMADLLGGSSGYILSKASATDMDFTWIANDQGDITGVTAGTGITVTSPTGPVPTVAIDTTVTVDKTTAQTLTNKTLTSPALTTPTISTATTNGDLLYGTGSGGLTRLGIGSTSQVLTVAAGVPSWATAASGGGMTSIASGSLSGASLALTGIVGTYKNLVLVLRNYTTGTDFDLNCKINALTTAGDYSYNLWESATTNGSAAASATYYNSTVFGLNNSLIDNTDGDNSLVLTVNDYADTTANKIITGFQSYKRSTGQKTVLQSFGSVNTTAAVTAITLTPSAGTWSAGTYVLYGVN